MYKVQALPKFNSQFKKFYPKEQGAIRQEINKILENPFIGERKKGPLINIMVRKFKIHRQLYLLAYETDAKTKTIYLYAIATHENFYETLRRYL